MHSCEVVVAPPPPIQGTDLLLELGTLIIEGRTSQLHKGALTPRTPDKRSNTITSYGKSTASVSSNQEVQIGASHHEAGLDDVHSRVLAAKLLNVKNYQKAQFKTEGGDVEKPVSTRSLSQSREQPSERSQHTTVLQGQAEALWKEQTPLCIDVLLAPQCGACLGPLMLLERWTMSVCCNGSNPPNHITSQWLLNAVRSQLHFSQISAWSAKLCEEQNIVKEESPTERQRKLSRETCNFKKYESNCDEDELLKEEDEGKKKLNVIYNIKIPGDDYRIIDFASEPVKHTFPITDIGSNVFLMVLLESLPRLDEIPTVQCTCSPNSSNILKRRRSRDTVATSEEGLAHSLANVCSLNENHESLKSQHKEANSNMAEEIKRRLKANSFSNKLGAINPDKGCSSGISRKFSAYSNPSNSDLLYVAPVCKESTPNYIRNRADTLPFAASCSKTSLFTTCKESFQQNCSYQLNIENKKVPSDKVVKTNFLLVDDRMQTPCGKKGKHRCNCDDESDHGSHFKDLPDSKNVESFFRQENKILDNSKTLDERRAKEIAKYLRRVRKEAKFRQLRDSSGQSSQENSECRSDEMPDEKLKSIRKGLRDKNSDLSIKDSRRYKCLYENEDLKNNESRQTNTALEEQTLYSDLNSPSKVLKSIGNFKISEPLPATSIPILQASRFDHAMRFGSYRTSVPFHGSLSSKDNQPAKELECACSSVGCDQMASVKTCKQSSQIKTANNHYEINTKDLDVSSRCRTFTTSCDFCNSDDNYRPVVKKMISSFTQTDDFKCDCGKSLVPKCFECSKSIEKEELESHHSGMKRTWGSHNLVGIDKSALLLEAIERPSRISESQKEETDTGIDAIIYCDNEEHDVVNEDKCSNIQVIENKCDNSFSDKNKLYFNNCYSSDIIDCLSASMSNHNNTSTLENLTTGKQNKNSPDKLSFVKFPFADNFDKAINFIRRPRLKRLVPIVDKLDKIVMERSEEKRKDNTSPTPVSSNIRNLSFENSFSNSVNFIKDSFKTYKGQECASTSLSTSTMESFNNENHIVVYERGDYGNITNSCMETKHGEKHSFEENERSCKHFRSDNGSLLTDIDNKNSSFHDQCEDKGLDKNDSHTLNNQLDHAAVPSVSEMDKFRWRLDSAACMVFHSRTGLPLTSSPAPLRRGKSSFDYDSSINSVSSIKSALYGVNLTDLETEPSNSVWSPGSSPGSPLHWELPSPPLLTNCLHLVTENLDKDIFPYSAISYPNVISVTPKLSNKRNKFRHGTSSGLLGSFEESVLNGRLEPAATVAGFTAEIGASGSFCPQHLKLPVTVFFYSLGDNTTSAPYLGHINLGRRGYNVPKAGTIQVTLFNPHGTVVKMFVVMYDMADMPLNSKTFLRQKTLCVPAVCSSQPSKQDPRALRYLVHLRFLTSKSGKVYLHTDVRIIVSRKADMDTAHSLKSAINPGYQQNVKQDVKKKSVETGSFKKRPINDKKNANDTITKSIPKTTLDQTHYNSLSSILCDESELNDKQNNNCLKSILLDTKQTSFESDEDLTGDKKDSRIRRRSDSMDGLPKELSYELRSFTYGPDNPKYSPR